MSIAIGNNLPRVKVSNQFSIKEVIYKFGPISRIEVSERLGLTIPTITTNISLMIERGLLREVDGASDKKVLGRKTMLVDFVPSAKLFLGVELRGSFRYVALIDLRGNVLASADDQTFYQDYEKALENAVELGKKVLEETKTDVSALASIGICTPGLVDSASGVLLMHPGYGWADKKIAEDYAGQLGFRGNVYLENNAISRAFGLSLFNATKAKGADSLAYMYVSSGIACPLLNNVHNHFGNISGEGEAGHMVMNPDGPQCSCGNHGCLEAYSSEKTMLQKAKEAVKDGRSPLLAELSGNGADLTMEHLLEAQKKGDAEACSIIDEAIRYLGLAIANIDNFVRPECVAIECRLFDEEENRKALMEVIHHNLYRATFSDYRFSFIPSDVYSGAKGAAAVAIMHTLEQYIE